MEKKTNDMETYYKEYRKKNAQHLKNKDRIRFYKSKYGLTDEFIDKYGDYSADAFKFLLEYKKIKEKNEDIAKTIISELSIGAVPQ
jgi:ABC-type dipeptide/oligopeptide/nickel transport system permease component